MWVPNTCQANSWEVFERFYAGMICLYTMTFILALLYIEDLLHITRKSVTGVGVYFETP